MKQKLIRSFILFILCCFPVLQASQEEQNKILVCENSLEMYDWAIRLIGQAEQSIEFSAGYCGGKILRGILEATEKRLEQCPQLQAYFLVSPLFILEKDEALIQKLQKNYKNRFHIQNSITVFTSSAQYGLVDNHIKGLIVDEKYFTLGGTNFDVVLCSDGRFTPDVDPERVASGKGLPGGPLGVRDQDVVGKGPIAKEMRVCFYQLYALWHTYFAQNQKKFILDPAVYKEKNDYFPLDEEEALAIESSLDEHESLVTVENLRYIFSGPMHHPNKITSAYRELIQKAEKEIWIGNLYFNPVKNLLNDLLNAANRGVETTIVTNGIGSNPPPYTQYFVWASRLCYTPLFYGREFHFWEKNEASKASVKKTRIFEYDVKDVIYHKKVMVVDGRYTIIGSYNLNARSNEGDYEEVFVIDSVEIAEAVKKVFYTDLELSKEVSPNEAKRWYFDPLISTLASFQNKIQNFL